MSARVPEHSSGLVRVVAVTAAIWMVAAGVVHLLAVGGHRAHPVIAAFFVGTALAQLGWGVAVLLRPSRGLLLAGIAGNLALIGVWLASRTTGLPFVAGAEQPESVGVRDVVAVVLESLAVATAGLAVVLPAAAAAVVLPAARKVVAIAAAAALVAVAPAALADGGHGHGAATHAAGAEHAHDGAAQPHDGAHDDEHSDAGEAHEPGTRHDGHAADSARGGSHDAGHQGGAGEHAVHAGTGRGDHSGGHGLDPQGSADGHAGHGSGGGHEGGAGDGHAGHGSGGGHDGGAGDGHADHADNRETFPQPVMWGRKTTMRIGPFQLAPKQAGGDAHVNLTGPIPEKPCQDCYITGIVPNLVYADGSTADLRTGPMMHHLVVADTGRPDPTCDRWNGVGIAGHRIFASGDERTPFSLPRGFGFRGTDAPWWFIAEIMNMGDAPRTVYVEADVYHVPASTKGIKPVKPIWLDVDNCRLSEYSVPAGRSVERWSWESTVTGRVIAAGGHVHAGGVGIVLSNADTRRRMCTSEAAYGTAEPFRSEVTAMSTCIWDRLGTVRRGQRLEIATIYDTPTPLTGVMGILMLAVYETDDLSGGTLAPEWNRRDPDVRPPAPNHEH